jgi:hypothetical protein
MISFLKEIGEKKDTYLNYFLEDDEELPDLLEICHDFPSP